MVELEQSLVDVLEDEQERHTRLTSGASQLALQAQRPREVGELLGPEAGRLRGGEGEGASMALLAHLGTGQDSKQRAGGQ